MNEFEIRGTIVGKRESSRQQTFRIATDGAKDWNSDDSSFPEVVFFHNEGRGFNVKDRVTVTGHVTNRVVMEGKNRRFVTEFVGVKIEKTKRILAGEEGVVGEEGGVPEDINRVMIRGSIHRTIDTRTGATILTIKSKEDDTDIYSSIVCYGRQRNALKNAKEGDEVLAAGVIRTKRDGGYAQNVICKDIEVIKKKEEGVITPD